MCLWWEEEAALLTLSGVQGGVPIASALEPLIHTLQPAGPLEEGLSLFFNKPLTLSLSLSSLEPTQNPRLPLILVMWIWEPPPALGDTGVSPRQLFRGQ